MTKNETTVVTIENAVESDAFHGAFDHYRDYLQDVVSDENSSKDQRDEARALLSALDAMSTRMAVKS